MSSLASQSLNEEQLCRFGAFLGTILRQGDCLALHGDLGAGKTTLARAIIRAATGRPAEDVPSPTFTLMQSYSTPNFELSHYDLYRIGSPAELAELALDEALYRGVCLIEWPEIAAFWLPDDRLDLWLESVADPGQRRLSLEGNTAWQERLTPWLSM